MLTKKIRTFKRIKVHLPLTYKIHGERKAIIYEGTTYDISDSGICFYTDVPLNVGLTLIIQIPEILDVPKTCIVKWNSMKSRKCFRVGVSFI